MPVSAWAVTDRLTAVYERREEEWTDCMPSSRPARSPQKYELDFNVVSKQTQQLHAKICNCSMFKIYFFHILIVSQRMLC